jgi:DNA polymerase
MAGKEFQDALHVDLETRSAVNLRVAGPWVYSEHWSTQVWVACFARGDRPVEAWHPGDPVPDTIFQAAWDGVPFCAHNVGFERAITATIMGPRHSWPILPIERWYCTAAMAAAQALPRDLEGVAKLLGCANQKDMDGHRLMKTMMKPYKTTQAGIAWKCSDPHCLHIEHEGLILHYRTGDERIARGTVYCAQDVRTERAICKKLLPLSAKERRVWILDQKMNERGVMVDRAMVTKALNIVTRSMGEINSAMQDITGGLLATQVQKLRWWLTFEGLTTADLRKDTITDFLKDANLDTHVHRALELRQEAAKTSTSKLKAYQARTCADSRMRDNLMYHGAGTGRWSGRGAQLQNLPSRFVVTKEQINLAIDWIAKGCSGEDIRMWMGSPLEVISACLKGMIVASPGKDLIASDYKSIEAVGTAWLAGAKNLLGVFRRGEDPYLYQASQIYKIALATMSKETHPFERQRGKIAVLSLGYQQGPEGFEAACYKERIIITPKEARDTVGSYRESNPEIPELWRELEDGAKEAVRNPEKIVWCANGRIAFLRTGTWLYMRLPSGRRLSYARPRIEKVECPWIDVATGWPAKRWSVTYLGKNPVTHQFSKADRLRRPMDGKRRARAVRLPTAGGDAAPRGCRLRDDPQRA